MLHTLLLYVAAQTEAVPAVSDLSNLLQKGGLATVAALAIFGMVFLYRGKEESRKDCAKEAKDQNEAHSKELKDLHEAHAEELKDLHAAHASALSVLMDKNRVSEEAKNEKIVGFVGKLTEVIGANTAALEKMTTAVDALKLDRR